MGTEGPGVALRAHWAGSHLLPLPPPPGPLTTHRALALDTRVAGGAGVVVGEGAGGRAEVKVRRLDRHGGIGRGHARVRLLGLQVSGWIPGQHAVLHTLSGRGGRKGNPAPKTSIFWAGVLLCDLGQATCLSGLPSLS